MQVSVKWQDGMFLSATGESNFPIPIDAGPEFGGRDLGARPMELILMGMAGCTSLDVLSILGKMRVHLSGFSVEVEAGRATDEPKVFTSAVLTYRFQMPQPDADKVTRAITLSLDKYCGAVNTMKKAMPIQWCYDINGVTSELRPV